MPNEQRCVPSREWADTDGALGPAGSRPPPRRRRRRPASRWRWRRPRRRTRRRRTGRRPGSPWQRFRRRPRARRSNRVVGGWPQWLPALARSQPYGELGRLDVTGEGRAVAQVGLRNPCDAVDHALASPRRHHACSPASPTTPAPRQDPAQARAARRGAAGPPSGGGPAQSSRVPAYMSSISSLNSRSTTGRLSFRLGVRSPCSTSRSRGSTRKVLICCQRWRFSLTRRT